MLRKKNTPVRSGKVEQSALSKKICEAIKKYNTSELGNVDMLFHSKSVWVKVRQLTGRSKTIMDESHNAANTAVSLNRYYAEISTDAEYMAPQFKCTANTLHVSKHIMQWRVFNMLEALHPTANGLDDLLAWFLKIGAPFFAAPIADMFNVSRSSSVVPKQYPHYLKFQNYSPWLIIVSFPSPLFCLELYSKSLFEIISTLRCNVRHSNLSLMTLLYAFWPTGSNTVALMKLIHEVTAMLECNPYVIFYTIDFSKAFDTVRHSELLDKYSKMELPDCIYNWIVDFC